MPRNIDPANIPVGSGTAPAGTVEDSSVVRYVKSEDPLRIHIQDPTRSHMAITTGIVDTGGYYTSEEVEGALQELGLLSSTIPLDRQNGWYEGGVQDIDTAVTHINTTITLAGTWRAVCTPGLYDLSGSSILLPDASTVWVFVHGTTGVLTQQAGVPDITTLEHVIVGRFTCAGNTVTLKEDGRFFLRNDNRKISYSVRSDNAAADANSEGTFYSIQAAFLWLGTYNSTNVSKKTKIVVRGANTVSSTLVVPIANLELEGEPGASITISGGGPLNLFDLNGQSNFGMSKILLGCNAAGSTAIIDNAIAVNLFYLDSVLISAGTGTWNKGIDFTSASQDGVRIHNVRIAVAGANAIAISMRSPTRTHVVNGRFEFTGGGGGPSTGIVLGDKAGGGALGSMNSILNSTFSAFVTTGITVYSSDFEIRSNQFNMSGASSQGVQVSGGSQSGSIAENDVFGTHQISYNITGLDNGTDQTRDISVEGNKSLGPSAQGVYFNGYVRASRIVDNSIDGWLGGPEVTATGIQLSTNVSSCPGSVQVSGNSVVRCADGISVIGLYDTRAVANLVVDNFANFVAGVSTITIDGFVLTAVAGAPGVDQFQIGGSNNATATNIQTAINLTTNSFYANAARATVLANIITMYAFNPGDLGNGVVVSTNAPTAATVANFAGGLTRSIEGITIDSNVVTNCARSKAALGPDTFTGTANKGIGLDHTFGCKISDNDVREIGIMIDGTGTPVVPNTVGPILESVGIYSRNSGRVQILGNAVFNCARNDATALARGIVVYQGSSGIEPNFTYHVAGTTIANNLVSWENRGNGGKLKTPGQIGIDLYLDIGSDLTTALHLLSDLRITGNAVSQAQLFGLRAIVGNLVQLSEFQISGNQMTGCGTVAGTGGIGIALTDAAAAVAGQSSIVFGLIEGNTIATPSGDGIAISGTRSVGPNEVSNIRVSRNKIRETARTGIYALFGVNTLTLSDLKVEDNELLNCGSAGAFAAIHVENTAASIVGFRNVKIRRNSAIGTPNAAASAIVLLCASLTPSGICIDENTIEAEDGTQSAGGGVLVQVTGNDFGITKSSFSRNHIYSTLSGIRVFVNGTPSDLQFDENLIEITASTSRPIWFETDKTTAPAGNQFLGRHFSIRGNILRGGRGSLFHSLRGVKIADLVVSDNQFLEVANADAETTGESAAFALVIDANAGLGLTTDPTVRNLLIEGNTFHNCQEEGLVLNLGPGLVGTYTDAQLCSGLVIKGNAFAQTAISGNGVGGALRILSCAAIRDMYIDGNSFNDCGAGAGATEGIIHIDFMSNGAVSLGNTSISGNSCDGATISFIKMHELSSLNVSAPNANIQNLRVVGNQLTDQPAPIFWADFSTVDQGYILEHIAIEDNNAIMITGGQTGVNLDLDGDLKSLSISGNKFSGPHNTSILVQGRSANAAVSHVWKNFTYESNVLSDFTVAGIYSKIESAGGTVDMYNQKFADNTLNSDGAAVIGIKILHDDLLGPAVWEGLIVSDNMAKILNVGSTFIELDTDLAGTTKRCFSFTGNNLVTVGNAGTLIGSWAGADILLNLVVVGNTSDGNTTTWAAFAAQFGAVVEMAVADNAT